MQHEVRRRYTVEYKAQGVLLAENLGAAANVRKIGISIKTLDNWMRLSREVQPIGSARRGPVSELKTAASRLRAENVTLRMAREFLKKR